MIPIEAWRNFASNFSFVLWKKDRCRYTDDSILFWKIVKKYIFKNIIKKQKYTFLSFYVFYYKLAKNNIQCYNIYNKTWTHSSVQTVERCSITGYSILTSHICPTSLSTVKSGTTVQCSLLIRGFAFFSFSYQPPTTIQSIKRRIPEINNL